MFVVVVCRWWLLWLVVSGCLVLAGLVGYVCMCFVWLLLFVGVCCGVCLAVVACCWLSLLGVVYGCPRLCVVSGWCCVLLLPLIVLFGIVCCWPLLRWLVFVCG